MLALALGVTAAGCGDDDGTMMDTDAGRVDAGRTDAGRTDAGTADGGGPTDDAGMDDAGSDVDAGDTDAGTDTDAGMDTDAGTVGDGIAAVRAATVGAQSPALPVRGVTVTYVRPAIGDDPAGFFVQAVQAGPALFVTADPGLTPAVAAGDVLDFDVTETANLTGVLHVSMATGWNRSATGTNVMPLAQDLSAAADLVSNSDGYVSEYVLVQGTLRDYSTASGNGHDAYGIDTAGVNGDANLFLRLAEPLVNGLGLGGAAGAGCQVTVGPSPLWRFSSGATTRVQLMGYQSSDIVVTDCPAPIVSSAMATSDDVVVVVFSRALDAASVAAEDFAFTGGLTAASVVLSADGTQATVTLAASMMFGTDYTVTVTGVTDAADTDAIDATMNTATFTGIGPTSVPAAGDLVITEIVYNPMPAADDGREWVELYNPSATVTYQLLGCEIDDLPGGGGSPVTIDVSAIVPPGAYVVIGGAMSETTAIFPWGPALNNTGDSVVITCAGVEVDRVDYDDVAPWPTGAIGTSIQLSSTALAGDNNVGSAWCVTPEGTTYGTMNERGTPGAANSECTVPPPPAPTVVSASAASATTVDVVFSTALDPATVQFGDFTFSGGLTASAVTLSGDGLTATVTTDAQTSGMAYTVTVTGVSSAAGTAIAGMNTAMFNGFTEPSGTTPNVIFSEYVEGSSNNKAIEITNLGTEAAVLAGCQIQIFTGATTAGTTLDLGAVVGTLAAGESYVICNSGANATLSALCDTTSGVTNFNGDEALVLSCGGTTIDMFGNVGTDPGSAWTGGGLSTADRTLRRQCSVTMGNATGFTDPSLQWEGFAQDTFSGLGVHCP